MNRVVTLKSYITGQVIRESQIEIAHIFSFQTLYNHPLKTKKATSRSTLESLFNLAKMVPNLVQKGFKPCGALQFGSLYVMRVDIERWYCFG